MITLLRYILYKQKEIKWKLALWQFIDNQLTELIKNPEEIEKKIMPYLADIIHQTNEKTNVNKEIQK